MPLLIGTSGWQYRHWRETFYPRGLAQRSWLEFYSDRFATVESNAAFYRLPEKETFEAWAKRTPDDFIWAVKVSRFLTHIKRLADPADPIQRFVDRASGLGRKLGPALLQLPPQFKRNDERLDETLAQFPSFLRVAVEFRHKSWWSDEVRRILERHGAAVCWTDRSGPRSPLWLTSDWLYVRFHHGRASPPSCYGRQALATWVDRLSGAVSAKSDTYAYFNNDGHACALRDAIVFARLAARSGLAHTSVPKSREVRLG